MITEEKLAQAEKSIEELADALGVSETEIVKILREGMESRSAIGGQLSKSNAYFLEEMESTFDCF